MKINKTSDFIGEVNYISYNKMIAYFNNLKELIESKYEMIASNTKKNDGQDIENNSKDKEKNDDDDEDEPDGQNDFSNEFRRKFKETYGQAKENNQKLFLESLEITEKSLINCEGKLIDLFTKKKDDDDDDEDIGKESDLKLELTLVLGKHGFKYASYNFAKEIKLLDISIRVPPFIFLFVPFPYLQVRILPNFSCGLTFKFGILMQPMKGDDAFSVYFDISGNAEVSISYEIGIYIPPTPCPVEMSLSVGIKGLFASATVGMKLSLFIKEDSRIEIELYMEFKAFEFTFYILFKIQFKLGFLDYTLKFYLINEVIGGIGYAKKRIYKYEKKKFSVKTKEKIGFLNEDN